MNMLQIRQAVLANLDAAADLFDHCPRAAVDWALID